MKTTNNPPLRLGGTNAQIHESFGNLAGLIGKWVGSNGWNLVAVPDQQGSFNLLIAPYTETLTISPLSSPTPNRGEKIIQHVPTLMYDLAIHNNGSGKEHGSLMHAENGTWLLLPDCPSGFSIARQASVPHGDSLLALGSSSNAKGAPKMPVISSLPIGTPTKIFGYTDPYTFPKMEGDLDKVNPNATLQYFIKEQHILETTTISVSTANEGGISNIPFITKNANTTSFEATFWIETVQRKDGSTFQQLQYSQTIIIEFLKDINDPSTLVKWPHVTINTLVKQ